jgi:phage terminase small subunit
MRKLTQRQKSFIELYDGNGTDAARRAGYSGSDNTLAQTARDLLRNPHVAEAIEKRNAKALKVDIANRQERQAFWSKSMRDEVLDMRDRLKASELLGKSEADFTEKHQVELLSTLTDEQLKARFDELVARASVSATKPPEEAE